MSGADDPGGAGARQAALARLQALLAQGQIDQAMYDTLSAGLGAFAAVDSGALQGEDPGVRVGNGASARAGNGAAIAQGNDAQALAARAVAVQGDNHGRIDTSTHTHFHLGWREGAGQDRARRAAYLARVWNTTNALNLRAGGSRGATVRLAAVYTALLTERRERPEPGHAKSGDGRGPGREAHDPQAAMLADRDAPRLSAVAVLDSDRRLVLLGGPGSGKSTFVNYVAQAMAGELLGADAPEAEPRLASLTAPLPQDDEDAAPGTSAGDGDGEGAGVDTGKADGPARQPWRHGALLPVRVVLRDLAAQLPPAGQPVGADDVWRYVCSDLQAASLAEVADALKAELRDHGGLVMFDGLDEVPEAHTRREQIQRVVEDFAASFERCRILVTSRTYAYQQQAWKLPGFTEAVLSPWGPGPIRAFVQAWFAQMQTSVPLTAEDAQGRAALLLRQVQHNPRVAELAARPLLLTLFARLQTYQSGTLPERREELYHAAVQELLNDWEQSKLRRKADGSLPELEPSLGEWLKASPEDIRKQLNRLAYEAHAGQQELTGTADIRQADLVQALLAASPRVDVQPRLLEQYLHDRAGILVAHGVGMVQFPHRSFQEYLAACHLANDDFPDRLAGLVRGDPQRWREVTLLAAAYAARGNSGLPTWALAEALCPEDAPAQGRIEPPDAWGALLAGQVLVAGDAWQQPAPHNRPKLRRVRDWQLALLTGSALPAPERALAGRTLALLGDPRPEVMTVDGMQFCWVPTGPFLMGSDDSMWGDEKPPHEVDLPAYLMARYPVTVAQWREALEEAGREPADARSLQGRANDPVVCVTWHEARWFCDWLTQRWRDRLPAGMEVALPSEAEWEKAARGGLQVPSVIGCAPLAGAWGGQATLVNNPQPGRAYPWGIARNPNPANADMDIGELSAVGCFPAGASPYGCEDLSGNAWEWTRSHWVAYPYGPEVAARETLAAGDDVLRVVRGGAFLDTASLVRCAFRGWDRPDFRSSYLGFRVVLRSAPVSAP